MNVIKCLNQSYSEKGLFKYIENKSKSIIYKYHDHFNNESEYMKVRQDIKKELMEANFGSVYVTSYNDYRNYFGLTIKIIFKSKILKDKRYGLSICLGDVI